MDATYILAVKERILAADTSAFKYHVKRILAANNPSLARERLNKLNKL